MSYLRNLVVKNKFILKDKRDIKNLISFSQDKFTSNEHYRFVYSGGIISKKIYSDNIVLDNTENNIIVINSGKIRYKITKIYKIGDRLKVIIVKITDYGENIGEIDDLQSGDNIFISTNNVKLYGLYKLEIENGNYYLSGHTETEPYLQKINTLIKYPISTSTLEVYKVSFTKLTINNGEILVNSESIMKPPGSVNSYYHFDLDIELPEFTIPAEYAIINITDGRGADKKPGEQAVISIRLPFVSTNGMKQTVINNTENSISIQYFGENDYDQLILVHPTFSVEVFFANNEWFV